MHMAAITPTTNVVLVTLQDVQQGSIIIYSAAGSKMS